MAGAEVATLAGAEVAILAEAEVATMAGAKDGTMVAEPLRSTKEAEVTVTECG